MGLVKKATSSLCGFFPPFVCLVQHLLVGRSASLDSQTGVGASVTCCFPTSLNFQRCFGKIFDISIVDISQSGVGEVALSWQKCQIFCRILAVLSPES